MIIIDIENRRMSGCAKAGDIQKYGLVEASRRS